MSTIFSNSIDNIRSLINKRGISKANLYEVDFSGMLSLGLGFSPNDIKDLTLCVDNVSIPGRQLQTFGYSLFRHPTEFPTGYVNEGLVIEFNMTSDMFTKNIFDKWIDSIVPTRTYLVKYADQYKTNITIKQLDEHGKASYIMKLDRVFPKAIRGLSLSSTDEGYVKFGVDFGYNDLNFIFNESQAAPINDKLSQSRTINGVNIPVRTRPDTRI